MRRERSTRAVSSARRYMPWSRAGTGSVVVFAALAIAIMAYSSILRLAADDLFATLDQSGGTASTRTAPGIWLAAHMAADVSEDDLVARRARADQFGTRSDRSREVAGAVGALGILVAVLTGTGDADADADRERATSKPAAKTTRTGTA